MPIRTRTMGRPSRVVACVAVVVLLPLEVASQDVGTVADADAVRLMATIVDRADGSPVPAATVTISPFGAEGEPVWSGESDESGSFSTDLPVGSYELRVEAAPFSSVRHLLLLASEGLVDVQVEMVAAHYELDPIVVVARRLTRLEAGGFYQRRTSGRGTFLTRDEIADRSPSRLSDLFHTIPGARVLQGQYGEHNVIRLRGGCTPVYVLDGIVMSGTVVLDDLFPVSGVEGIEVYHGAAAPMEYVGMTSCGVVMLWSGDPSTGRGSPFTWTRLLVGVGFGALAVLLTH